MLLRHEATIVGKMAASNSEGRNGTNAALSKVQELQSVVAEAGTRNISVDHVSPKRRRRAGGSCAMLALWQQRVRPRPLSAAS
jgi:hypothetical protein